MGISGLLAALKEVHDPCSIKRYAGQRVGVDAYVWLHRGSFACALELCTGEKTTKYINYVIEKVRMMQSFGVTPVLVFDGANLPNKGGTDKNRHSSREINLSQGKIYLKQGNRAAAIECFQKAVDITPLMAHKTIQALKSCGVECIVAPYEADAQLTYLASRGLISAVVSEDSDLLPYGCQRVMFKMDKNGNGQELRGLKTWICTNATKLVTTKKWDQEIFMQMCVLSGCDYLPSLNGMGLVKANQVINVVHRTYTGPSAALYEAVIQHLQRDGVFSVPSDYMQGFRKAVLTFRHQRVWDPEEERLRPLTELPPDLDDADLNFLGPDIPADLAKGIAMGMVDPNTHEPFEVAAPIAIPARLCGAFNAPDNSVSKTIDAFFSKAAEKKVSMQQPHQQHHPQQQHNNPNHQKQQQHQKHQPVHNNVLSKHFRPIQPPQQQQQQPPQNQSSLPQSPLQQQPLPSGSVVVPVQSSSTTPNRPIAPLCIKPTTTAAALAQESPFAQFQHIPRTTTTSNNNNNNLSKNNLFKPSNPSPRPSPKAHVEQFVLPVHRNNIQVYGDAPELRTASPHSPVVRTQFKAPRISSPIDDTPTKCPFADAELPPQQKKEPVASKYFAAQNEPTVEDLLQPPETLGFRFRSMSNATTRSFDGMVDSDNEKDNVDDDGDSIEEDFEIEEERKKRALAAKAQLEMFICPRATSIHRNKSLTTTATNATTATTTLILQQPQRQPAIALQEELVVAKGLSRQLPQGFTGAESVQSMLQKFTYKGGSRVSGLKRNRSSASISSSSSSAYEPSLPFTPNNNNHNGNINTSMPIEIEVNSFSKLQRL